MKSVILFLLTALLAVGSVTAVHCSGGKACLQYGVGQSSLNAVYYWYDSVVKDCATLRRDCTRPNDNVTFSSLQACQETCKAGETPPTKELECDKAQGDCDKDLAPTTPSSSLGHSLSSVIISVSCVAAVAGLVGVVVATTFVVKRRKKVDHRKRKLEEMLTNLTDPYGSSDDSFDDNPEDNNLFDRLEGQYW